MSGLLRVYVVLSLCGWAVLPLVRGALRALPDRGYSFCRCFGWILTAWTAWIIAWLGGRPLTTSLALGSLLLVGVSCWLPALLAWRRRARAGREHPVEAGHRLPAVVVYIEALFVAGLLLFGSLQARNPAVDPDSERFMDYALLKACLRSPGLPVMDPWMAGAPTVYYHFGYAMVAFLVRACGRDPKVLFTAAIALSHALLWIGAFGVGLALTGRARGGAWSAFLVLGAGNMEWIRQGLGALRASTFDWFASSRTIQGTITEVPWFSFLWGDLHPYVLSAPIVVCVLACCLARRCEAGSPQDVVSRRSMAMELLSGRVFCFALAGGAALAVHPWDFPLLIGVAAALALILPGRLLVARLASILVGAVAGILLFLPFVTGPATGVRGLGRVVDRSAPIEWLLAYAPFTLLGILTLPWIVSGATPDSHPDPARSKDKLALILAGCALFTALLGEIVYVRDLFESTTLRRMNTVFKLYRFSWLLFAFASAWLMVRLAGAEEERESRRIVMRRVMARLAPAVVLGVSLVYPIFGTAAWLRHRTAEARRQEQEPAREALRPGADADALFRALSPGDAAAAGFLARTAAPGESLMEETGDPYTWSSRISTFSGVPAVLGWGNHEAVWRQGWEEVERRQSDIALAYAHPGTPEACDRLLRYGVTWIVWGDRERRRYDGNSPNLESLARPVFSEAGTAVYRVRDLCTTPRGMSPP